MDLRELRKKLNTPEPAFHFCFRDKVTLEVVAVQESRIKGTDEELDDLLSYVKNSTLEQISHEQYIQLLHILNDTGKRIKNRQLDSN